MYSALHKFQVDVAFAFPFWHSLLRFLDRCCGLLLFHSRFRWWLRRIFDLNVVDLDRIVRTGIAAVADVPVAWALSDLLHQLNRCIVTLAKDGIAIALLHHVLVWRSAAAASAFVEAGI